VRITFDAKRAFNNETGLGNYSRSVIKSVSSILKKDQFFLSTPKVNTNIFNITQPNIKILQPNIFQNHYYWRTKGVNRQLNDLKIDIYHGLSNEIPLGIETKSIVTIHDLLFLKYPKFYNYIDRKIYTIKSRFACKYADKIIATSQETKKDIINYFNINEKKIKVIYQSCNPVFINNPTRENYTEFTKKELAKPFILYVGSIEKRKNLIFLLKAIQNIKDIKLICVGKKGKYYQKVETFIHQNQLIDKVKFLNINNTEQLAHIYRHSRGLVYPSINEGFGIPIIEGMYSKIPVITSNKSIFKEVGGEYSYYFEEQDLDSLIDQIQAIWYDSNERSERIEKNFQYVQKFTEQEQANQIIKLYKEII
tara:strand:+ start:4219 stop:5313 length:1095 start_codon:yes stop_codon:yes gene_type:complete